MSEENIEKWQKAVTPERDTSKPWTMGNGGSWDLTEPVPISDEMLAELAVLYRSMGCPWNCQTMPLSDKDREYMYLLYYSMQGMVARIRAADRRIAELEHAIRSPFQGG